MYNNITQYCAWPIFDDHRVAMTALHAQRPSRSSADAVYGAPQETAISVSRNSKNVEAMEYVLPSSDEQPNAWSSSQK
jgi:hypothetical protein